MPMTGMMGQRPAYRLYQLAWSGIDWLFPPECGGCGKRGARWCFDCQNSVQVISSPVCHHCGQSLSFPGVCLSCQTSPGCYTALRSWAAFGGSLRNALHKLKYRGDLSLGEILSRPLIQLFQELDWSIDMVVPVPIGAARKQQRGYNQAALLAKPLALSCGVNYSSSALIKTRETRSQVGLSLHERRINVSEAFFADRVQANNQRILVVDDVVTSGATINACAETLLKAGAREVFGLTLTRAVHKT